jgi:predicted phage gp36 major capsid-like protein
MTGAEVKVAQEIANSQNAWAIMFILLFLGVLWGFKQHTQKQEAIHADRQSKLDEIHRESREDAKEREKALIVIIDRQSEALEKNTDILESMQETQKGMQETQKGLQEGQRQMERRFEKLEGRFDHYDLSQRQFKELNIGRDRQ